MEMPLEHTTRRLFIDGFLTGLGWQLAKNVVEEARSFGNDETIYLDYVGVSDNDRTPHILFEAKAWDKPFVSRRQGADKYSASELIVRAIEHIKKNGKHTNAPVSRIWHEYLDQVCLYVRSMREQHGHNLKRAVLLSGQWIVIFKDPVKTFVEEKDVLDADFIAIAREDFVELSNEIYRLISRPAIIKDPPEFLRPNQLLEYVRPDTFKAAYHGGFIHYVDATPKGGEFRPNPMINVYPLLFIQTSEDDILCVRENENPFSIPNGDDRMQAHLAQVDQAASNLRERCATILNTNITPSSFDKFPGLKARTTRLVVEDSIPIGKPAPLLVRDAVNVGDWFVVTADQTHFLRPKPTITCRFHALKECGDQGAASGIVLYLSVAPRSFSTDTMMSHCAHESMIQLRDARCLIAGFDDRTCCKSCNFHDVCWKDSNPVLMPCGS